jgi:uncharacterized protein YrrD
MLHSFDRLRKGEVHATDGSIGSMTDLYFDDSSWVVRYLIIDTGKWLPGRRVLVSPLAMIRSRQTEEHLELDLTMDQVRHSPDIDTDRPVSRQAELDLFNYYGWVPYWMLPVMAPAIPPNVLGSPEERERSAEAGHTGGDPHLQSGREAIGYTVQATDGDIGHIDDFLFDDETNTIRYLVVATGNWLTGKRVVIPPERVSDLKWADSTVKVRLTRADIRNRPEYDASAGLEPAGGPGRSV